MMMMMTISLSVESMTKSQWTKNFFTPVAVVLLFNLGDLMGRTLATWFQWPKRNTFGKYGFLVICILRTLFIPLFMYTNANPDDRKLPVLIK